MFAFRGALCIKRYEQFSFVGFIRLILTISLRTLQKETNRSSSSTLAEDGYFFGIPTKKFYIILNPF